MKLLVTLLLFLKLVNGEVLFRVNEGYDFESPLVSFTVFSEFNKCTACTHFYTANFNTGDKVYVEVLVPANAVDVVTVIKIIGPEETVNFDTYDLDNINLLVKKKIFEIDTTSQINSSVILQIESKSPHAHYAVRIGKEETINVLDYTLRFAWLVQRLRMWSGTFVYFIFFLILSIGYFLLWPLYRIKSYVIFPKLAIIGYISWIVDSFFQYFFIIKYSSSFSIVSFLFHIFPNVVYSVLLSIFYEKSNNKEIWLLSIAGVSLLYGGGGFYISTVCLLISYVGLITMKNSGDIKDNKKLFCGVV